jgi:hypothetical protein
MTDLDARVAVLKQKAVHAADQRATAEREHAVALDRQQQVVEALKTEFGVTTHDEVTKLLEQLRAAMAAEADIVDEALRKAGTE